MSFNTNYILPGDDKNQIIGKVNYNFSQILSNAVGLPGESGILGATGIIGQVGKDGSTGPTGSRANKWYFQQTPPFGNIPYSQAPLINYDVWVNTSPGSTGGPNRIYQYSSTGGNYSLYPFWVDTLSNFAIDGNFTLLQGVSGPGEVTEKNAVIIGGTASPSQATFVFTDREVTEANANPRYSKILIENDASITASLPLFSLGKTFYSVSTLPSFYWQNIGDNYDIKFSSGGEEEITIQSQATGSYASTGGTASLVGSGINWNSSTTASIIGPSGISINSSTIGFTSLNTQLQAGAFSLSNMSSGMGATSYGSDYALSINGVLDDSQSGLKTVLEYSGFYGGNVRSSLALGVSGGNLFTVGNSPAASQISATYAALVIGYTGSTGVSGGTGANIVKSYQSITDPASSTIRVFSNLNNSIQITPSNDVIIITPTPTGPIISDGSRINRIWLNLTYPINYTEPGEDYCVDLFMNSLTYCIGGVSVLTNSSRSNYTISDSGQTSPGATGGCRHVRLNFYGSTFPSTVNTSGNRFFYLESFSSGYNSAVQLPYNYPPQGSVTTTRGGTPLGS